MTASHRANRSQGSHPVLGLIPVAFILAGLAQSDHSQLPVTVRCELSTELPLEKIAVSVEEKREVKVAPEAHRGNDGTVTITDLPEGDLHLLFFYEESLCGTVELSSAHRGDLIRLKVRLVTGNAILLDEVRIRGISGFSTPNTNSLPSETDPTAAAAPKPHSTTSAPGYSAVSRGPCPAPGALIAIPGRITRLIDNDSFELQSATSSYVVYIGSSTRFGGRGRDFLLREQQSLLVKGAIAAGPEGECSIGAKDIQPKP